MSAGLYVKIDHIDKIGFYSTPCNTDILSPDPTYLMAPNGFSLTELEIALVRANKGEFYSSTDLTQKHDWLAQDHIATQGVVLNHSLILYRRAYDGEASQQLWNLAQRDARIHRVLQQKPRWGLDLSLEYIQSSGTIFEILHWEYDTDNWTEAENLRCQYQDRFLTIDWEWGAKQLLSRKSEWHHLGWFPQSKYKCEFFGVIPENFGQVFWL